MVKNIRFIQTIRQGTTELLTIQELEKVLLKKKFLVKVGFDPTTSELHLGHFILIQKMQQLQKLGFTIIFLIGDFTTIIGDPTGRNITRKKITKKEIKENYSKYHLIVEKFLLKNKTKIINNSFWLTKLNAENIINLASKATVAQLLKRKDFAQRYSNNVTISLHEFLYPLFQGFDSVAVKADMEIGGIDQKFNLLLGRELQKSFNQKQQILLLLPILEGLDGVQKMSKTLQNHIRIDESPENIYGKIMSITDTLMWEYIKKLSILKRKEITEYKKRISNGYNPKNLKMYLSFCVVERIYNKKTAQESQQKFIEKHVEKKTPINLTQKIIKCEENETNSIPLVFVLKRAELTKSTSESLRLITQGAIKVNGIKIKTKNETLLKNKSYIINVGKKKVIKIHIK